MLAQIVLIAIIFILILVLCFKKSPPQSDEEVGDVTAARSSAEMAARAIRASEDSPEKRRQMASASLFHRTLEEGDSVREIQSILAAARDIHTSARDDVDVDVDVDDDDHPVQSGALSSERHDNDDQKGHQDTNGNDPNDKYTERVEETIVGSMRNSVRSVADTFIGQVTGGRSSGPECIICLEKFATGDCISWSKYGDCGHIFHSGCITEWLASHHDDCPLCRITIIGNAQAMLPSNEDQLVVPTGSADGR